MLVREANHFYGTGDCMTRVTKETPVRFAKSSPCPICGGHDGDQRGRGVRCYGFLSGDGKYAHCTREEHAGGLPIDSAGTYAHFLGDCCRCGRTHRQTGTGALRLGIVGTHYDPPACDSRATRRLFATAKDNLVALAEHETRRKGVPVRVARIDLFTDATGRPWMAEGRFEWGAGDKSYRTCHYTAEGWQTGDPPPMLPLLNLPLVIGADKVLVLEGPKCAEIATKLGYVATTSSHGAKSAHRTDWSPLAGKTVVIIPDCDPAGDAYEAKVRELLAQLNPAPIVKVLRLPGLEAGEDIAEWKNRQPELWSNDDLHDELERLIAEVPVTTERWATAEDVKCASAKMPWIWPGWIPGQSVITISGFEGTGKSRFVGSLIQLVTHGFPWPDGQPATLPRDSRFLWICSDGQHAEIPAMLTDFDVPLEAVVFPAPPESPFGGTDIDDPDTQSTIRRAIAATRPALVIVDSITSATSTDIASAQSVKPLKELFLGWCQDFGCSVIFLSHLSAEGNLLGRRLLAVARTRIDLNCPDEHKTDRLSLAVLKSFGAKPAPLGVTMGTAGNTYDNSPPARVINGKPVKGMKRPPTDLVEKARIMITESLGEADHLIGNTLLKTWTESDSSMDFNQARSAFWTAVDQLAVAEKLTKDGGIGTGHQVTLHRHSVAEPIDYNHVFADDNVF